MLVMSNQKLGNQKLVSGQDRFLTKLSMSLDLNIVGYSILLDPNHHFFYVVSEMKQAITVSIDMIEKATCLKFVKRTNEVDYIEFTGEPLTDYYGLSQTNHR